MTRQQSPDLPPPPAPRSVVHCPICTVELTASTCWFYLDVAFCPVCYRTAGPCRLTATAVVIHRHPDHTHFARPRGLVYWTPRGLPVIADLPSWQTLLSNAEALDLLSEPWHAPHDPLFDRPAAVFHDVY